MPFFPVGTLSQVRPESWPPAPGRGTPALDDDSLTDDDDLDLPLLQRDPLKYFLTPPTPDDEELDFQFDFDAGIEDANKPQEIVRSVSPSTLDGLKRYKAKGKGNDCAIIDDESDEEEDYIRFRPSKSFPLGLPDFGIDRPKSAGATQARTEEALLSPNAFHVGSPRGRPAKRFSPPRRTFQGRSRSVPLQRRHSWREPSVDVWSIEEEPEKETLSESGLSTEDLETYFNEHKTSPINIPATKPKKKVRFVLPDRDSFH
ncbi:hypothetical protein AB5N19_13716 [Seiridium cardinale]|uniref:Uncharacterized protein n=1 Tax=Seiridium cardinale TaxID=138064 RepID=A0ABR2XKQ1_9PEZI